jgi:hypothetical protein
VALTERAGRLALADIRAAVIVKSKGLLALAEDVGDRAIRLARVEHRCRRVVTQVAEGDLRRTPGGNPTPSRASLAWPWTNPPVTSSY